MVSAARREAKKTLDWTISAVGLLLYLGGAAIQARMEALNSEWDSEVRVHEGSLSVHIRDGTLGTVLDEIERQASVIFDVPKSVEAKKVTDRFENLSLLAGIKRLLEDTSYLIDQAPAQSNGHFVSLRVRVLGTAGVVATSTRRAEPAKSASGEQAARRAEKLMALADEADGETVDQALKEAISDPDALVREAALEIMDAMDEERAPAELLEQIALHDTVPALRMEALDTMATLSEEHEELVRSTLQQALNDKDLAVRELASNLLGGH